MKRLYTGICQSNRIEDVISDRLDIKLPIVSKAKHDYVNVFDNIYIPLDMPCDLTVIDFNVLDSIPQKSVTIPLDKFIEQFTSSLRNYIRKNYDYSKQNVLFFSSGYDSRLLGKIMYDELKSFDNLTIIIRSPEHTNALPILDYIGFPRSIVKIYNENTKAGYGDIESFNWKTLGLDVSGICEFPVNIFLNPLRHFEINKDAEIWFGLYFNELFNGFIKNKNVFKDWYSCYYYGRIAKFLSRIPNKIHTPILNYETIETILISKLDFDWTKYKMHSDIRKDIIKIYDPELLEFENQPETFTRGLRFVNKESFDELKYNYSKSIIGKKFPIKPESNYESRFLRDWWTHCTLASFVDNLNVEINFI